MTSPIAPGPTVRQTQRIERDLRELQEHPLPFVRNLQLAVVNNLNAVSGVLIGPEDSAYAGGHFRFLVQFPPEYPLRPPVFFFVTAICHPNVHSITTQACHEQFLARWAPAITLSHLLTEMHSLLATPNYDVPVEADTLEDKSPENARQWTQSFAQPTE